MDEPVREADGSFVVPGSFEVSRLRELFTEPEEHEDGHDRDADEAQEGRDAQPRLPWLFPQHFEATTLGGLVSEIAGHIPLPGEVVEGKLLRFEVIASTDRKVERVRVGLVETAAE
jgi:CBS domain containing-hemolysin-like protein